MSRLNTGFSLRAGLIAALGLVLSSTNALAFADGDTIRVNQQSEYQTNKPRSGLSMQQVEDRFGSPSARAPAVGEPPITRWVYNEFTVYFEHDRVIHSVAHRS